MRREERLDIFVRPTRGNNMAPEIIKARASHQDKGSEESNLDHSPKLFGKLKVNLGRPCFIIGISNT